MMLYCRDEGENSQKYLKGSNLNSAIRGRGDWEWKREEPGPKRPGISQETP